MWPDAENTQTLLASVGQGNAAAVNQLLERHRGAVRRMIAQRIDPKIRRRVDASDIVQEVMLEANRRLNEYLKNPVIPFHLWLRQISKDRLIDAFRRHRIAARRSLDREQPLSPLLRKDESAYDLAAQLRDQQQTPAAAAAWHELKARFEEACEHLDPQDQEVVLMRHFEELSNSEVATALGITPQAASMRYLRAMRRLRQLLAGDEPTD
jgi:RNA polymerase sigma-70 factor (ECF subfamily)